MNLLSSGHKISFVGDSNVGKTSIITRVCSGEFDETTNPTIGVSNHQISIPVGDQKVYLNIWDTAGQERFRALVPIYTRDANCIVLVFDLSQRKSFEGLNVWYQKLRDEVGHKIPIVVAANKSDLEHAVSVAECKGWCDQHEVSIFFTSAATGENINDMFCGIADLVTSTKSLQEDSGAGSAQLTRPEGSQGNCC